MEVQKQKTKDEIEDDYVDDFEDDDIMEDLPKEEESNDQFFKPDPHERSKGPMGVSASQSLGVDPSIDSMKLDEYDYVEPVEKIR